MTPLSPDEREWMDELYGYFSDDELHEHLFDLTRDALRSSESERRDVNRQIDALNRYVREREH